MEQTIRLLPYSETHYEDLMHYELDEERNQFTVLPKENLATRNILADPEKHAVSIMLEDKAIGFFVFDSGADKAPLADNAKALLLRSLSVNPAYQGRGFGRQAMTICDEYVQHHLAAYNEIVLSVNLKNTVAYGMYVKAGFTDTGKIIDGRNGLQHVMAKPVMAVH